MSKEPRIKCETCDRGYEYAFAVADAEDQDAFFEPESEGWCADGYGRTWCPDHEEEYLGSLEDSAL